jgi:carbamoyltransferase
MTAVLGISAFYHDSAAALVVDGAIVAAAQEERFSRKKNDQAFPTRAIRYCLEHAGLRIEDLDYVGFYDKPLLKFERLLETYLAFAPRGFGSFLQAMPKWLKGRIRATHELAHGLEGRYGRPFVFTTHHESHAASAFFPSPFEEAAILTLDGVGEWATASYGSGRGNRITLTHELRFPHSVGLLYSAFTYYCGFKVNEGEYKLMGLAPYGEPSYSATIVEHIVDLKDDGSIRLDLSYFDYCTGLTMTSEKFHRLFGGPPRAPHAPLTQRHMDIAASIQKVIEEIMLRAARHVHAQTGLNSLCLAGGVALNCVGNGRILREGPFDHIWVQPAAGDAGGALGVAMFIWHQLLDKPRRPQATDSEGGALLGPAYDDPHIFSFLEQVGAAFDRFESDEGLCDRVAQLIADGKVVGWFQGRMEFGPRALGSRSILADARSADMQSIINLKVKFREGFRPFAPAVLRDHATDYFDIDATSDSPYMLIVCPVKPEHRTEEIGASEATGFDRLKHRRSDIQAVTHVDYSARIQTVDEERHGLYHALLVSFYRKTGCPVLVNTSFNLGWEPIVCTPEQAYATFMSSDIDALCIGRAVVLKERQNAWVASTHGDATQRAPEGDAVLAPLLTSPCARDADLRFDAGKYVCTKTGAQFALDDGVPLLSWPPSPSGANIDFAGAAKSSYEAALFPSYDEDDSLHSHLERTRRGEYARRLYEELPFSSTLLEVGCGTGHLTNFLAISTRRVIGADPCLQSLRLAEKFRREHGLVRARFVQMNPFHPCFKPAQFDVVLCSRFPHHTTRPRELFARLVPLVKPGGHILVGLYSLYGRLATDLRRAVFGVSGGRDDSPDPHRQPHESSHSVRDVLNWFDECGLQFVRAIPSVAPKNGQSDGLLEPTPADHALDRLTAELGQILTGRHEGGFFVMIGKRPTTAVTPTATRREAPRAQQPRA